MVKRYTCEGKDELGYAYPALRRLEDDGTCVDSTDYDALAAGQAAKAAALDACVTHLTAKLKKVQDLLVGLPITTPELIRLRNANKITFDKQVNSITTCLIQLRECFEHDRAGVE